MTTNTTTPRRLQPVAENIYHDGAPFMFISPTKGMRNAAIIYEAIKDMPDKNLVRGDFDKKSAPFIFFPERLKKKIGQSERVGVLEAKNIESGRKEFAGFLKSIADTVYTSDNPKPQVMGAIIALQLNSRFIMEANQDFKVADIKEPLRILKNAYYTDGIHKKATLHRLLGREDTKIQSKRFREFIKISGENFSRLCASLKPPAMDKYATEPQTAVFAVKMMIRGFLDQKNEQKKSFASVVRENSNDPDVLFFARRWVEILKPKSLNEKGKGPSKERIILNTESWAKEFDKICPMILKAQNRGYSMQPVAQNDGIDGRQPLYQRSSSLYLKSMPQLGTLPFSGLSEYLPYSSLIVDKEDESSLVMSSTSSSMGSEVTRTTDEKTMSESSTDSPTFNRLNTVRKTSRDNFLNVSAVALPDLDETEAITETVPKFIREISAFSTTALSVSQMDELLSPVARISVPRIVSMEGRVEGSTEGSDTSEASGTEENL